MTKLNDNVRAVCKANYDERRDCADCPIRKACHAGPTGNLTQERMEQWRAEFNTAADAHVAAHQPAKEPK